MFYLFQYRSCSSFEILQNRRREQIGIQKRHFGSYTGQNQSYRRNKNDAEKNEDKNQNEIQKPHGKIISCEGINEDIKEHNSSSKDGEN